MVLSCTDCIANGGLQRVESSIAVVPKAVRLSSSRLSLSSLRCTWNGISSLRRLSGGMAGKHLCALVTQA
jgi:hypothetical protein